MIIANPIYDAVFKRLLENDGAAKFLIGTILDCNIISLEPYIQERTKFDEMTGRLTLYRKDFSATIESKDEGVKRVIIELQKAKQLSDIYRFREYLGGEYANSKFPIIAIYILGFNLSVDVPAFAAYPECKDLRTQEKLEVRDSFVEHLTHKSYFVQTRKIKQSLNTKLDMLLSIFGQENFVSADETTKDFPIEPEYPEIKELLGILHYVAVNKQARKELDEELYYQRYVEQTFGEKDRKIEEYKGKLEEQDKELKEKGKELEKARQKNKNIAKELKLDGMPVEKISKLTGLTTKEIESL
ncbi:MAG: hypothetical protein FWF51_02290 [Chitinivibrionia bacterium]|nr:hypothetical protein [Chitinivibrionia bacterium]